MAGKLSLLRSDGGLMSAQKAEEHPGSWWPYWLSWIEAQAPKRVKARQPGEGKLKALCPAPGTYVSAVPSV